MGVPGRVTRDVTKAAARRAVELLLHPDNPDETEHVITLDEDRRPTLRPMTDIGALEGDWLLVLRIDRLLRACLSKIDAALKAKANT